MAYDKQIKQKQTHRFRAQTDACHVEGELETGGQLKELRSTHWQLQNNHRNEKYSIENIINNIVIIMHGIGGGNRLSGITS